MSQEKDQELETRMEMRAGVSNRGKHRVSRTDSASLDSGVSEVKDSSMSHLLHHHSSPANTTVPVSRINHHYPHQHPYETGDEHDDRTGIQEHDTVITAREERGNGETASSSGSSSGLGGENVVGDNNTTFGSRRRIGSDGTGGTGGGGGDGDGSDRIADGAVKLKRKITLLNGTALVVGTIIGSGIFVSPKGVFEKSGESVSMALLVWILCGLFSMLGSLCFSELGTTITRSGGEYAYVLEAFGPFAAFNNLWIQLLVIRPTTQAISALTFAYYITSPFLDCSPPPLLLRLVAASCICESRSLSVFSIPFIRVSEESSALTASSSLSCIPVRDSCFQTYFSTPLLVIKLPLSQVSSPSSIVALFDGR